MQISIIQFLGILAGAALLVVITAAIIGFDKVSGLFMAATPNVQVYIPPYPENSVNSAGAGANQPDVQGLPTQNPPGNAPTGAPQGAPDEVLTVQAMTEDVAAAVAPTGIPTEAQMPAQESPESIPKPAEQTGGRMYDSVITNAAPFRGVY